MSLPFFIAKRHLFGHHKIGYISFISIISVMGLGLGVAALILTLSILKGFEKDVKSKLVDFDAHVRLRLLYRDSMDSTNQVRAELENIAAIQQIVPYIHRSVMIRYGNETDGVILEGIRRQDIIKTLNIQRFIVQGDFQFQTKQGTPGLIIGEKLALKLGVEVGDPVYLFLLEMDRSVGHRPRIFKFRVTGLYRSGIAEYDDIFVYSSLAAAQELFDMGASFSGFQMLLDDPQKADQVAEYINTQLGYPYHALSWTELHRNLFEWLRTQRFPILLVFGLIAVVAIFNVVSTLMMIVIEKTRDIGILKSMGVNSRQISKIFILEAFLIGITGVFLGYILAFSLGTLQIKLGIIAIPEDVYFMSQLPVLLQWSDFLWIGLGALFFTLIATIYPTLKANRLSPSEATRYE